jgi:hypothetical protein
MAPPSWNRGLHNCSSQQNSIVVAVDTSRVLLSLVGYRLNANQIILSDFCPYEQERWTSALKERTKKETSLTQVKELSLHTDSIISMATRRENKYIAHVKETQLSGETP